MHRTRLLAVIVLSLGAAVVAGPSAPSSRLALKDVPYVENGGPDQVMDVFWTSSRPKATVLFIHGGSLQEAGERRSSPAYAGICKPFVVAGIACASMDYRLAPTHVWPAMPDDVAAAIVKLRQLTTERGGDPRRLFVFGHSSGCHLAAIVGTNPEYLGRVGLKTTDLAGIIAMGCTLDREDAALRKLTAEAIRSAFSQDREDVATYGTAENWLAANPASYIGKHVPPTLVILCRAERFMPAILEQGARFIRRLLEEGVPGDVVIVPGRHMSSIAAIGGSGDPTFAAIRRFIEKPEAVGSH